MNMQLVDHLSPPVDRPVSTTWQAIVVSGSYAIWLGLLIYSVFLGRKEKTIFYTLIILAAGYGGIYEPIYDEVLMLYFYRPGMWRSYTAFDIPQPVWVYSGYATLYGSVAMFLTRDINKGLTRRQFYQYAVAELLSSCTFEIIAINGGVYEYWGPHVFRVFAYPICIGLLEMAQVMLFSVAAANLRARSTGIYPLFALFAIFPITMLGANCGAGGPLIVALHSPNPTEAIVTLGSLVTIGLTIFVVWAVSYMVPLEGELSLKAGQFNENGAHADVENGHGTR